MICFLSALIGREHLPSVDQIPSYKIRLHFWRKSTLRRVGYTVLHSMIGQVGGIFNESPKINLVVTITVVVILQEEVLVCAVSGKSDSRDTETGEKALEAVEAAEGAIVAPGLTLNN